MPHLNFLLAQTARATIAAFLLGTQRRWVIEIGGEDHIEDTGEPWDSGEDWLIDHMLWQLAGQEYGEKTLLQVLTTALMSVAAEHVKHPAKAAQRFLADLRRRSLNEFLHPEDDAAAKKLERALRARLAKLGFKLRRSERRDPLHHAYGSYHVDHIASDALIADVPVNLAGVELWANDVEEGRAVYSTLQLPPTK